MFVPFKRREFYRPVDRVNPRTYFIFAPVHLTKVKNAALISRYIPFVKTIKSYSRSTFLYDLPAGIMVAILLVPQAIAYAYLAGMPPQYGLYASLIPILIYAFLGTSPHLAIGPVAISAILILAGVSKLDEPFSTSYIELVILAGLLIGVVQVVLGFFKLGRYINLLSYPVITGFTSAASIIVITSQFKDVLGVITPRYDYLFQTVIHTISNLSQTHYLTLAIAVVSFLFIFLLRRLSKKIPGGLIVVTLGILISYFFDLANRGVDIIGFVPEGLPEFNSPSLSFSTIISLLPVVIMVTIIGIIESVGIAKAIENKNQFYEIDTNKELIALGTSKIAGSFFSAFPSSGSFSRSALLHEIKAKTTVASIITVLFVMLSLLFLTPLLFYLPKVILAVIIIYAVKNLFEYRLAKKLIKIHRFDFAIMFITFLVTLLVSIEIGVATGFLVSLFNLQSSDQSIFKAIGKIFSQKYKDDIFFSKKTENELKKLLVVQENLHFGNAYFFKDLVKDQVAKNASISEINFQFNESIDLDSSAIKSLNEVLRLLRSKEISFKFSNLNSKTTQRLKDSNIDFIIS